MLTTGEDLQFPGNNGRVDCYVAGAHRHPFLRSRPTDWPTLIVGRQAMQRTITDVAPDGLITPESWARTVIKTRTASKTSRA